MVKNKINYVEHNIELGADLQMIMDVVKQRLTEIMENNFNAKLY